MKTKNTTTTRLALLLTACLAAPFAANAADPQPPVVVSPDVVPTPDMGISQDLNRSDSINARLATRSVTSSIESASFATRDDAIKLAQHGVNDGRALITALQNGARSIGDGARAELNAAFIKTEQSRARLVQAIAKATDSTEARWTELRTELAERYEEFATALEDARKLATDNGARFDPVVIPAPPAPPPAVAP